jgi:uncharacterized damage-inducible protein DinB
MQKPLPSEHREYFQKYIDLVPEGNYIQVLQNNTTSTISFFNDIPTEKHECRYAEGKWSIKEVLLHLTDTERIFSYRALVALRGDSESLLPSMDENLFAANADVSTRTMQDLLEEFNAIRTATRKLYENINDAQSIRTANASGFHTSVRALGYMIIGHVIHHMNITQERYL